MTVLIEGREEERVVQPRVDVREDGEAFLLEAEMPGVEKGEIRLELKDKELLLKGRAESAPAGGLEPLWRERGVPRFERRFVLGRDLDEGRLEARLEDGVLKVRIPKAEKALPRKIEIQ